MQRTHVARHVGTDLDDALRSKDLQYAVVETNAVETEQIACLGCRKLQQRHLVGHAGLERRARLGVEAYDRARAQIAARGLDLRLVVDDHYASRKLRSRQRGHFVVRYCREKCHSSINYTIRKFTQLSRVFLARRAKFYPPRSTCRQLRPHGGRRRPRNRSAHGRASA